MQIAHQHAERDIAAAMACTQSLDSYITQNEDKYLKRESIHTYVVTEDAMSEHILELYSSIQSLKDTFTFL